MSPETERLLGGYATNTLTADERKLLYQAALEDQDLFDELAREQALIAGHVDMEFSGFVTVTAPSRDALAAAVSQVEQAVGQSTCETRILYGRQSQGFVVSALPFARSVL